MKKTFFFLPLILLPSGSVSDVLIDGVLIFKSIEEYRKFYANQVSVYFKGNYKDGINYAAEQLLNVTAVAYV